MHTSDHSKFFTFIQSLPDQISESFTIFKNANLKNLPRNFNKIVLLGMGGSAIGGDLLNAYIGQEIETPLFVNRNYTLPNFVDSQTWVIACSYSGNTEETLEAAQAALKKNASMLCMSSGGSLKEFAAENNLPFIQIPESFPPRQALGYMFFPLLHLFHEVGLIGSRQHEIEETVAILKDIYDHNNPQKTQGHNFCNQIAQRLYKRVPVIYSASALLNPVTVRWRNQFNENSKILAFSNVIPELNHNEIMGWQAAPEILSCFSVVLLRDISEMPRNKKRLEITRRLLRKSNCPIFEIFGEGRTPLARLFSQIYIGDWTSYYLALLNKQDPLVIENINYLKDSLSKV